MRNLLLAAATAATILAPIAAEARPLVIVEPAYAPRVVLVGAGCGFGFHRGAYGGCVRNGVFVRPVVRVVAPLVYGRGCFTRATGFGYRRVCR